MRQERLLKESRILDFRNEKIEALVRARGWRELSEFARIGEAYKFVRDDIRFGYNRADDLPASKVLENGYGQCNTKGNLLMALFRALGIPCRFHGFTIKNELQRGAIPSYVFSLAPDLIIHSWVEVYFEGQWLDLEGFILDETYLRSIQERQGNQCGPYQGFGVATSCLQKPEIDWQGKSTYIQKEGIHDDFGVFDTPDEFYAAHGTNLRGIKRLLFQYVIRHLMNWNVSRIRKESAQ